MRPLFFAAAALASAACFAPRPCTQALCPSRLEGTYRVMGWNRAVAVGPGAPAVPIVSDSEVEVTGGSVEFVNGKAVVRADAGALFRFEISTSSPHAPLLRVSAGSVTVALSSGAAPASVAPGSAYLLPVAK
jgi:hypothetical protein